MCSHPTGLDLESGDEDVPDQLPVRSGSPVPSPEIERDTGATAVVPAAIARAIGEDPKTGVQNISMPSLYNHGFGDRLWACLEK